MHNVKPCRGCGVPIVFLTTHTGARVPVNADSVKPDDQAFEWTRHTSHFATCPDAGKFRNKGRRA